MDICDKNKIEKLTLSIILIFLVLSCNKDNSNKETDMGYSIDLSVKYNEYKKSFRIENDGKAIVLINKTYAEPKVYSLRFSEKEMNSIQNALSKLPTACDSISNHYNDGTQYIAILTKQGKRIKLISDTCKQMKPMDTLVSYILKTFEIKKKDEFYLSLKAITPPPLP